MKANAPHNRAARKDMDSKTDVDAAQVERLVRRSWAAALWFQDLRTDYSTAFGDCREVLRVVLSFETWFMGDE